ncbi:TRAP transporter fused permease subunit [Rhodobacteraceae bacterium NNCM2]|nr:TRAP transporter fused permease subunit [Coraliihabitans acroporae]
MTDPARAEMKEIVDPVEQITAVARVAVIVGTLGAITLSVYQLFNIKLFGITLLDGRYLYLLGGIFLGVAFITFRAWKGAPPRVPWYDWLLVLATACTSGYLAWTADLNLEEGWEFAAPVTAQWVSVAFYLLILEGTRRTGGLVLFLIVTLFSVYPTFAGSVPDPFSGFQSPFMDAIPYHILSSESAFGIPMKAFGALVIGFILFGAVLQRTGGGKFFNDLALALVGRFRGGAAKVSIFASGFMGSMSGSVISNVLTTGAVSIPAMRRSGFTPTAAAATEACASTGGVLMPPIMGATAFVMASFLSRPYVEIAVAASIPSLLFYFGLFAQIDAYSARRGLKGMPKADLPRLVQALREGWLYIFVFALLIFMMVALRRETTAPFYATALLLIINQILPSQRFSLHSFGNLIVGVGKALAELTAVLLGVGLIVGSFSATGLSGTLVNELVFMAGDDTLVLLLMGALTAFIFGMGMTVTACYIFLAVVLAPALEQAGLNQLAVHLFILYWGMVSFITPPVALGAFAAATMAGASPFRTGLEAMRFGGVIYLTPFFFVLNPALVGEAPAWEVITVLVTALIGVWFISAALQGYVSFIGSLGHGTTGMLARMVLFCAGLFFAAPANDMIGLSHLQLSGIGLALAIIPLAYARKQPDPVRV